MTDKQLRILMVEPNTLVAESVSEALNSIEFAVTHVSSAHEALELLEKDVFDLAIFEYRLPEMTGIELKKKIAGIDPGLPIIITTAFINSQLMSQASSELIDSILLKPYTIKDLTTSINKVISNKQKVADSVKLKTYRFLHEGLLQLSESETINDLLDQFNSILKDEVQADEIHVFEIDSEKNVRNLSGHKINKKDFIPLIDEMFKSEIGTKKPFFLTQEQLLKMGCTNYSMVLNLMEKLGTNSTILILLGYKNPVRDLDIAKEDFGILANFFLSIYKNLRYSEMLERAYTELLESLASTIEEKDRYTGLHSGEVERIALSIAEKLGLTDKGKEILRKASLLHDIGKIGITDEILNKPGKLTDLEYEKIKEHPLIGYRILSKSRTLQEAAKIVLHHHEWYGGRGYPFGLAGEDIPLLARIICLSDAFHALTSDRSYRPAFSVDKALEIVKSETPEKFDPELVAILEEIIKEGRLRINYDQEMSNEQID